MKPVTCINVARETGHAVLSLDGAEYAVSLDDLQKILADIAGPRPAPATELLRPSLLPKLAQCPCYVSSPDAGEAAGALANSISGRVPYDMGRYIRLKAVADASSGDNTAANCELSIRV